MAPPRATAAAWLRASRASATPMAALALAGGAPLAALALAGDAEALDAQRTLMRFLAAPDRDAAMATAEQFARSAPAPLVHGLQRWLADCVAVRLTGRVRYHPRRPRRSRDWPARADSMRCCGSMQRLAAARRTIDHPLNVRLMLEALLLAYADAMMPIAVPV